MWALGVQGMSDPGLVSARLSLRKSGSNVVSLGRSVRRNAWSSFGKFARRLSIAVFADN